MGDKKYPDWLGPIAIAWIKKHEKHVELTDKTRETFYVCADTYEKFRLATVFRERAKYLDFYLKFTREFNMLPRSAKHRQSLISEKEGFDDEF